MFIFGEILLSNIGWSMEIFGEGKTIELINFKGG
jgi:hypothetical protein